MLPSRFIICLFQVFFLSISGYSQNTLSGKIVDAENQPLAYANILLLNPDDSSLIVGNVSAESGDFILSPVSEGSYLVRFSMIGFDDLLKSIRITSDPNSRKLGTVRIRENSQMLAEVEVVAKRPLYEQKIDRLVVNVAKSVTSAGNTALQILKRTPGVMVNEAQNMLAISGKQGVVVMINGKESRMPVEGLISLLSSMSADNIESIELIHTPPSNFDAEGNAGFINIVLKNNLSDGFNGSYALNAGYGFKEKAGASVNFNFRKNKVNLFGDYSWSYTNNPQEFTNYRAIEQDGNLLENDVISDRDPTYLHMQNARLGMDYQISRKTLVGVLIGGMLRNWDMDALNTVTTKINGQVSNLLLVPNQEVNDWQHALANFNLNQKLTDKQELNFDIDYAYYTFDNPSNYDYQYYDEEGNLTDRYQQRLSKKTPMNIYVSKLDYTNKISEKINFEAGVKGTLTRFENDVFVENFQNLVWVRDPVYSSLANMEENIAAAYTSISFPLGNRIDFKGGLRYEWTTTNLGTVEEPNIIDRKYGRIFPSAFFTYRINEANQLQFSYSRRISRPGFMQLAPFFIFYDPNTILTGNASLQPSFSDGVNLNYLFKTIQLSLSYTHQDEFIANFQPDFDIENNRQVTRPRNFDWAKVAAATISFPVQITKWWMLRPSITGDFSRTRDDARNSYRENEFFSWNASANMNFTFPKDFSAEFSAFYLAPTLFGGLKSKPLNFLTLGVQKKLPGEAGKFSLVIEDILFGSIWRSELVQPGINYNDKYRFGERLVRLTYSRNFGNTKVKGARQRDTGSKEERERVN